MRQTPQHTPDILDSLQKEMDDDLHPLLRWIVDHIKGLGIAAATIIAIVAGWTAFEHYQDIQRIRLQEALAQLSQQPPSAQTIANIKAMAAQHPKIAIAALLEGAAHAAALKKTDDEVALWQQLTDYESSLQPVATLAGVQALLQAHRFSEALTQTQQTSWPNSLKPLAINAQAFAAENAGQTAQALSSYQELKTLVPNSPYIEAKIAQLKKSQQQ